MQHTPLSNSFAVAVTTAASTAFTNPTNYNIARFAVVGAQPVYVTLDGTTPAIPADGANAVGFMLLPNSVELLQLPSGAQIRFISGATGSTVYTTFGVGG